LKQIQFNEWFISVSIFTVTVIIFQFFFLCDRSFFLYDTI